MQGCWLASSCPMPSRLVGAAGVLRGDGGEGAAPQLGGCPPWVPSSGAQAAVLHVGPAPHRAHLAYVPASSGRGSCVEAPRTKQQKAACASSLPRMEAQVLRPPRCPRNSQIS